MMSKKGSCFPIVWLAALSIVALQGAVPEPSPKMSRPTTGASSQKIQPESALQAIVRPSVETPRAGTAEETIEIASQVLDPERRDEPHPFGEPSKSPSPDGGDTLTAPEDIAPSAVQTVLYEGFEGIFPSGQWNVFDGDGATNGNIYWDDTSYRRDTGSWSAWCADGGPNAQPAGGNYLNNMQGWMINGPFSLSDAIGGTFSLRYWNKTELNFDYLYYMVSINGTNFYGFRTSGDTGGWTTGLIDLSNVPTLGNVTGRSQVWIAILFTSDSSITYEGSYVDEVRVEKITGDTDLVATEVYFRDQPGNLGNRIDSPQAGQQLYPHFRYTINGTQSVGGRVWTLGLPFSGITLCNSTATQSPGSYIGWCTSPWTATSGLHNLNGRLDPDGTIPETNENNNEANQNYTIGSSLDLVATEVYFRDQPANGGNVVDNPTAGQPVYAHFRFSLSGGTVNGTLWALDLPSSGTSLCAFTGTISPGNYVGWCNAPWTATQGTHTLRGRVDPNGAIAETSEGNNSVQRTYSVSAGQPDIRIDPLSLTFTGSAPLLEARRSIGAEVPKREFSTLPALKEKAESKGRVRVLVGLNVNFTPEGYLTGDGAANQRQTISAVQDRVLQNLSGTDSELAAKFTLIPYLALEVDSLALGRLESMPDVVSIVEEEAVSPTLASSAPVIGAPTAWAAGYTGAGQTVAILDTGVDKTHSFFTTGGNKVVSEACYSTTSAAADSVSVCPGGVSESTAPGSGVNCSFSGCDHGTHVAGIAAGDNGVGPNIGIGRGASLIAIQVFSRINSNCGPAPAPCPGSFPSDQIKAMERVYALRSTFSIASVNMSLGGGTFTSQSSCDSASSATKAAIDTLRSVNIATVIAAGNDGQRNAISTPGCISSAISVGATDDNDNIASFSNVATFLDLLAPGVSITSSVPGGGIGTKNGTSMATPHVAGAWAILKQANPGATVDQILSALRDTGTVLNDGRSGGTVVGMRRINVDLAVVGVPNSDSFTVYNDGAATLNVTSIAPQTAAAWISWSPAAPFTVPPGGSRNVAVSVNFSLAPVGSSTRRLLVQSNDPDESPYPGGVNIVVNRSATCYTLTRTHTGSGSNPTASPLNSSGCSSGQYTAGQTIQLTASPASGWTVGSWSGTNNNSSQSTINTLTMPSSDRTVTVNYVPSTPGCYTLTIGHTGSGGDPARSPANSQSCPSGTYLAGASVQLTASPAPGWTVGSWTGTVNDGSTSTVNMVTMPTGGHSASVHYVAPCFTLSLSHIGNGFTPVASPVSSSGCPAGQYHPGEVVSLDAGPGAGSGWTLGSCCQNSCGGWTGTDHDSSRSEQNQVTMPAANHAVSVIYTAQCSTPPVAIQLIDFEAVADGGGTLLHWQTGHEADNLGFHVYRTDASGTHRVTPSLIAGSALLTGSELTQGYSYAWRDPDGDAAAGYWLEDIDLYGSRTRYGPFPVKADAGSGVGGRPISTTLSKLGRTVGPTAPVVPVEWSPDAIADPETRLQTQRWLAAAPALKISVGREGLYRMTQPELVAAGLDPDVQPQTLRLFSDGVELPLLVSGQEDGRLDPQDVLVFHGTGQSTPWSDTRIYWLVESNQPGLRLQSFPTSGGTELASFVETVQWRPRTTYFSALQNGDEENFFGPTVAGEAVDQPFDLPFLDRSSPFGGRVEVQLQGVLGEHEVVVSVNGSEVGRVAFSGMSHAGGQFELPQGALLRGVNEVRLLASENGQDVSLVDRILLSYPRRFQAEDDRLIFEVAGGSRVRVTGFSKAALLAVDVTDPSRPVLLAPSPERDGVGFAMRVTAPEGGLRRILASSLEALLRPDQIRLNRPSEWSREDSGAEAVFVTHRDVEEEVLRLQRLRESQGRTGLMVDVEDLYDEYTYGSPNPQALRDFLRDGGRAWRTKPAFLVLAGDATVDPKNYLGYGRRDSVPTRISPSGYAETADDDWFADLDDDGVADLAVGRLPVENAQEARVVVDKIIDYETASQPGPWRLSAAMVSDWQGDFPFDEESGRLRLLLPSDWNVTEISRSQEDAAARLQRAFLRGQAVVTYLGHGSVQRWAGGLLNSDQALRLGNGGRLPFVISMACLTGLFNGERESLAEALLAAPQGGAIAVLASPSLDGAREQTAFGESVLGLLFGDPGATLGETIQRAKREPGMPSSVTNYVLFGDPMTRLNSAGALWPSRGWRPRN